MKAIILFVALSLAGCAVSPKVQYKEITTAADMKDASDSFFLQRSIVHIEKAGTSAGKDEAGSPITIAEVNVRSQPAEERSRKLAIKPVSNWRQKTNVNIVKIANTELISSIGVDTTDTVVKSISDVGDAAIKVITLTAHLAGIQSCVFPLEISITGLDTTVTDASNCAKVVLDPLPLDVIPVSDIPMDADSDYLYYSACRSATVTLTIPNARAERSKIIRVSDPTHVQRIKLPYKGSVTMHSECGVSVLTQAVAESNSAAVVDALATQGKAIKDALEAAK